MKTKYPRTFHVPWSNGTSDDKFLSSLHHFENKRVIVTEKMDGENSTGYHDGTVHARSLDSANHPSRSWLKCFFANFHYDIPPNWRICGENLFAKHSIQYNNLKSYFYCFSVWNENNICLSWKDTKEFCNLLNIETVPVLYDGVYDESVIRSLWHPKKADKMEGYVIRTFNEFHFDEFKNNVAKFVRPNHITTSSHWMHSEITKNKLLME